jgi:hypothetical protein
VNVRRIKQPAAAWVALALSLAVHVVDEALGGFLAFYNPLATQIRASVPFLALPVFTLEVWLGGLAAAIVLLLALTPLARRHSPALRRLALGLAPLMVLNAVGHALASVWLGEVVPGTISSPLLFAAALNLAIAARGPWRLPPGAVLSNH